MSESHSENVGSKSQNVNSQKIEATISAANSDGDKLLLAAEKNRLIELVQLLHKNSDLINYTDIDGYTALHRACYSDNMDCVKYLVRHGANIEAKTKSNWTPLHCAVRWNNIDVVEYLLSKGANVNAISEGGNTPLHIVASNGRHRETRHIIELLLDQPNCDYKSKNNSGDTSYDIAKRSGPFYKLWAGVMTLPSKKSDNKYEDNDTDADGETNK